MTLRRFMIQSRYIKDGYASFDGDIYNHMVRVLRLGPGDSVMLVDEQGTELLGSINQVAKEWVAVKIESTSLPKTSCENTPRITVCQALPKGEKVDLILQKGTELGAAEFRLFGGRRSIAKLLSGQEIGKLERWHRIVAEASRQCGRVDVPVVSWFHTAEDAVAQVDQDVRLILWEAEKEQMLRSVLTDVISPASAIVAIGPEGGFDPIEVLHFTQAGFQAVSLGNRILRTETASIAILSIMQYTWGQM